MLGLVLYTLCLSGFVCIAHANESWCASSEDIKYSCKRRVVIAIDDMEDGTRARAMEYTMARTVLRYLNIRNDWIKVALATYGTNPYTCYASYNSTKHTVCNDLDDLFLGKMPAYDVPPSSRKIQDLVSNITTKFDLNNTQLILFTKFNEQQDVDAASGILWGLISRGTLENLSTIVVNMGYSSFNTWPKNHNLPMNVYAYANGLYSVAEVIGRYVCGDYPITFMLEGLDLSTTTEAPKTTAIEVPTTTTTVPTTTRPRPPEPKINPGCECNLKTVWLDVFLLIDASITRGRNEISSATDYVLSAFEKLTVGQAEKYQTRLGVIRYASSVELVADLNKYTSTEDLLDLEIQPLNEKGLNLDGAIRLARAKFASTYHRRAARKVIIIVGSNYRETEFDDPARVAKKFRSEGGIIITIEYLEGNEKGIPMYRKLASPNYGLINYTNGKQLRAQELRQLLCKANCFCRRKWVPYTNDKWDAPEGGCYLPVKIPSIQKLASTKCRQENAGMLAVDEDIEKDAFLTKLVLPNTNFWLGLRRKGNQWMWPDGRRVGNFTRWAKGLHITENGGCVYMQKNGYNETAWFSDECDNDHFHICQTKPCDSTKYCPF